MSMIKEIQWYLPKTDASLAGTNCEHIAYFGCMHFTTPAVLDRLRALLTDPPKFLFFGGDFLSSEEYDQLKYHFYEVVNTGRGKLKLHENTSVMEACTFLTYPTKQVGDTQRTLADEYRDFAAYYRSLGGSHPDDLPDRALAVLIQAQCMFSDYGSYTATLSEEMRRRLSDSFCDTSNTLLPVIEEFRAKGTQVHIVAGNWDNVANTAKNVGMDTVFDAMAFFNEKGIPFHELITCVPTETSLQVLVPYWDFWPEIGTEALARLAEANRLIQEHRAQGKTIIMVAHGQPVWEPHFPGQECKNYNVGVMKNLALIIDLLRPDEFIYPHQHNPMKNSAGQVLDVNMHYLLRSVGFDSIEIVREGDNRDMWSVAVATYVPLHHLAHMHVPNHGDKRPQILGGTRLPAMVQSN